MPIANYTTSVTARQSIEEIQRMLVRHGARQILMDYDKEKPVSLAFIVTTPSGEAPFRIPANIDKVKAILTKQRVRVEVSEDLASRVAWRILKDWIRAQMAILETEMVNMEQIFLPYMITRDNRTLYENMVDKGFYLTGGKPDKV